jgi:DNA-damage-inducible protein D
MENQNSLIPFEGEVIRKVWHNEQWYFSVVDVIYALTDSSQPNRYWADVKKRSIKENEQPFAFCEQLKLKASDGRQRLTDCANTEGVLRIVMSVPSPKAEPLKLWMASVSKQALDEAENPELLTERQAEIYKAKGYSEEWIKERLQSINTRKLLTDEWKQRGVKEGQEYSLLTAIIAKGTFGITPSEHKDIKGLDKPSQNLRDHMTDLELILTALGEAVTRTVAIDEDAQGFNENKTAARKGGEAGGQARRNVEKITGKPVVSAQNYLNLKSSGEPKELPDNKTY